MQYLLTLTAIDNYCVSNVMYAFFYKAVVNEAITR